MTIIIHTKSAKTLYDAINSKINSEELRTWEIKKNKQEEVLYNHSPQQWSEKVLLKPINHPNGLELTVKWWANNPEPDDATKGYIIGRFSEILLVHFRNYFEKIELK